MTTMDDDDYPGGWFGQSWGAEVCEPERHKPTPVGEPCMDCQRPIEYDDRGLVVPHVYRGTNDLPAMRLTYIHIHCFTRGLPKPSRRRGVEDYQ
jgi:hypothetical protein